jgi:two-component system, OmpR family, phosphate regulon response regulator OmpR
MATMANAGCVLIVDDDASIREMLAEYLGSHGFVVAEAEDGTSMRMEIERAAPDVVLLDLRLPREDGLTLARYLRERYDVGIIMVTGSGEVVDRIVGLEVGADDYLAKPFNPRELLARVRAVLRRRSATPETAETAETPEGVYRFGPYQMQVASQRLLRDGEEVSLTAGEFTLLRVLVEHPQRVLDRNTLLDLIKGYEHQPFDRSIDVRVARLRRKIEADPGNPRFIRTVWGRGYLFAPDGSEAPT